MQKAICRRLIDQLATLNSADINSRNYIKEKIVRADIECVCRGQYDKFSKVVQIKSYLDLKGSFMAA